MENELKEAVQETEKSNNPLDDVEIQNPEVKETDYEPQSKGCSRLDVSVPIAMRYEIHKALETIDRRVNGVDFYVAEKLGYCIAECSYDELHKSMSELCEAFSAEQVDGIAVAIYNIEEKGQGVIIGDSTGLGKGRQAAGIIRYAIKKGLKPIFLTEKPYLFTDFFRDVMDIKSDDGIPLERLIGHKEVEKKAKKDIADDADAEAVDEGFEEEETRFERVPIYAENKQYKEEVIGKKQFVPFIINGRSAKTEIKDEDGNILYKGLPKTENDAIIASGEIPSKYSFAIATYSQFRSRERNAKMRFLFEIAKGNIIILDESHNSSGASHTGVFLKEVLDNTLGVTFLSATFAKRPDNMPIYAGKTAMSDANLSNEQLVDAISAGGVALQEIVSSQLVSEGQLLRRERSYDGIEVNWIYLDETQTVKGLPRLNKEAEHRATMDIATSIIRDIMDFQRDFVEPEIEAMDKIQKAEYAEVEQRKGTKEAGIANAPIFNGIFHIINQLLFSIKADAVAEVAISRLKQKKKPIIAFANTMESFLNTMTGDDGELVKVSETISSDFSKIFEKRLKSVLRYTVISPEGEREHKMIDIRAMSAEFGVAYTRIMDKIKESSIGISSSPIDVLIDKIENAGYSVAEVTGRDRQLKLKEKGQATIQTRIKQTVTDAYRDFNDNRIDCLLINQSGSTGASAHAKPTDKVPEADVKQRVMIVLQPELNINTEVQKRGRIYRTGQIFDPIYDYVVSAIPAEKRLIMMLQKKLKSLDANVSSNQKESVKLLQAPDFLNKYGGIVVEQYLRDNPLINDQIGDPLKLQTLEEGKESEVTDKAQKVSGRIAILPIVDQERFYNDVTEGYIDLVEYLIQSGEYDLEVESMNLEAETLEKDVVIAGKGGDSVFGRNSVLEKCRVNNLKKPFTKKEVENMLKESLNGFTADTLREQTIKKHEEFSTFTKDNDLKDNEEKYKALISKIREEKQIKEIKKSDDRERAVTERQNALEEAKESAAERIRTTADNKYEHINRILGFFSVGKIIGYPSVVYSVDGSFDKGIFLGFDIKENRKNPYAPSAMKLRFATISSQRYIAVPASKFDIIDSIKAITYENIFTDDKETLLENWDELAKEKSGAKTIRYIVTGNILQAFGNEALKGNLISYTTSTGGVKKGILLPEGFTKEESKGKEALRTIVPIIKALPIIKSMQERREIITTDSFSIMRTGSDYRLSTPKGKQKYGKFFGDETIMKLTTEGLFNLLGGSMVASLELKKIDNLVEYLQDKFNSSVALISQEFEMIKDSIVIEDYTDEEKQPDKEEKTPTERRAEDAEEAYKEVTELATVADREEVERREKTEAELVKVEEEKAKEVEKLISKRELITQKAKEKKKRKEAMTKKLQTFLMLLKGQTPPQEKKEGKLKLSDIPDSVKVFMPEFQQEVIVGSIEHWEVIERLEKVIDAMPVTYEAEGLGYDTIAQLHYFSGGSDWYITEKDRGDPEEKDNRQKQAFGYVILNDDFTNAEFGYIDIEELKATRNVELDFFWQPQTIIEILKERGMVSEEIERMAEGGDIRKEQGDAVSASTFIDDPLNKDKKLKVIILPSGKDEGTVNVWIQKVGDKLIESPSNAIISATFYETPEGKYQARWIGYDKYSHPKYQRKGLATAIYDLMDKAGMQTEPATKNITLFEQSEAGKKFWENRLKKQ